MSFKQNDINDNNMIHLGNYEEYFILYMDNELNEDQVKMVDAFLAEHPDLQGEFELLMSTRLPLEEMNISKKDLMADSMKLNTVDEELLLYIDNELPESEKKVIELELKSNKDYRLQHDILMKTRLNPVEKLAYPNKEELYRKEERKVGVLVPWLRVAAAVVVIAIGGVFYFNRSTGTIDHGVASTGLNIQPKQTGTKTADANQTAIAGKELSHLTGNEAAHPKNRFETKKPADDENLDLPKDVINNINVAKQQNEKILEVSPDPGVLKYKTTIIENKSFSDGATAKNEIVPSSEIINNSSVTSGLVNRKTDVVAADPEINNPGVASNKGSVKGFLRKTTRLIEKRTGIDPTSNGELLIGAVAINLN